MMICNQCLKNNLKVEKFGRKCLYSSQICFANFFIKDKIIIRKKLNKFQPIIVLHSIFQKNIWKKKKLEKNANISPQKKFKIFILQIK
jgi:hypothetical protein